MTTRVFSVKAAPAEPTGDERTCEIGARLHTLGGRDLMVRAHREIQGTIGPDLAQELTLAWNALSYWRQAEGTATYPGTDGPPNLDTALQRSTSGEHLQLCITAVPTCPSNLKEYRRTPCVPSARQDCSTIT
jgi:hypothetical protein